MEKSCKRRQTGESWRRLVRGSGKGGGWGVGASVFSPFGGSSRRRGNDSGKNSVKAESETGARLRCLLSHLTGLTAHPSRVCRRCLPYGLTINGNSWPPFDGCLENKQKGMAERTRRGVARVGIFNEHSSSLSFSLPLPLAVDLDSQPPRNRK